MLADVGVIGTQLTPIAEAVCLKLGAEGSTPRVVCAHATGAREFGIVTGSDEVGVERAGATMRLLLHHLLLIRHRGRGLLRLVVAVAVSQLDLPLFPLLPLVPCLHSPCSCHCHS